MPFDGSGTFQRVMNWANDAAASIKITAARHDQEDDNLAQGLSNVLTKDGQTQPTNNLPMNGKKLINLGQPSNPQDAATKKYVDDIRSFTTTVTMTGADANGRIRFSGTGITGLEWTTADLSLLGKPAVAGQYPPRLALNNKVDGTGTDVAFIDDSGRISAPVFTTNASWDGANWRTPAAGYLGLLTLSGGSVVFQTNYPATVANNGIATLLTAWSVSHTTMQHNSVTSCVWNMSKAAGANTNTLRGLVANTLRWNMELGNSAAESGTNVGSNFALHAYDNTGAIIGTALSILRSTLDATFGGKVIAPGYRERTGTSGSYGVQHFNFNYVPGLQAWIDTTNLGTVSITCDYRIKQDVAPLASMWEKVKALKPVSYAFTDYEADGTVLSIADGVERWGFLAHELQEALLPSAASGTKDEANLLQSPDLLAVVSALTKALQEAMERIEALEAR